MSLWCQKWWVMGSVCHSGDITLYCNWYDFTKEIFNISGWDAQIQIIPIKSSELKMLARRPIFSTLTNKKLDDLGLRMRDWKEALRDYLIEKGYSD